MRHLTDRGTVDTDGFLHDVKVAWRAMAMLQEALEARGAPLARGARLPEPTITEQYHAGLAAKVTPFLDSQGREAPAHCLVPADCHTGEPGCCLRKPAAQADGDDAALRALYCEPNALRHMRRREAEVEQASRAARR